MRAGRVTFLEVLRNRQFFALWLAQFVSNFGDWLALLALLSLVAFRRHGAPAQVSGIFIAFVLPLATIGPAAGVFVDRWNLKATMIASDLVPAVIAAALTLPGSLYPIYLLVFALGAVSCFFLPAQTAMLPLLVREDQLLVANAANTQTVTFNKIVSPAIAGFMVARFGENLCFYLDSLSFLVSAALLATLKAHRQAGGRGPAPSFRSEFAEGFRFIAHQPAILFLTVSMVMAVFAAAFLDALGAVYIRDLLAGDTQVFGVFISLAGVGTIVSAGLVGRFGQRVSKLSLIALGIGWIGVTTLLLAATNRVAAALGCAVLFGLGVACIFVSAQTLLQQETPQAMLGRASSAIHSVTTAAQLLSLAIAGAAAAWLGIRTLYYLVGAALVLIGLLAYLRAARVPAAAASA